MFHNERAGGASMGDCWAKRSRFKSRAKSQFHR